MCSVTADQNDSMQAALDVKEINGKGRVIKVREEYLPLIALYESFNIFTEQEVIPDFNCSNCKENHPNIKNVLYGGFQLHYLFI